ncbi:MAG: hypothetical protein Fur0037_02150 [Planctomycetota bacterium]
MTDSGRSGFTLIELLVVIAILSLLVVAFLPDLKNAREGANETSTGALLLELQTGIKAFVTEHGYYPPDDLQDPAGEISLKADNGINTSSESLVIFLAASRTGVDFDSFGDRLGNTDGDDLGGSVPNWNHDKRLEIVDAWRTPLAYFSKTGAGFAATLRIRLPEDQGGDDVEAKCWAPGGRPLGSGCFQLVSAGADRTFHTDDDITLPSR